MKKRILIVENDKDILNIISYLLNDEGYEVNSLPSIKGIFDVIHSFKPDAILLDIIVPGVEGTEICKTIKTIEAIKDIPLIVLSTHPKVTSTIKDVCADEVISKPFDINELINIVEKQVPAA